MADIIKKATNKFTKGLVMDFSPENTKNEVLTHALNATLLTFNGNELSLQNDMGNTKVETAYLPEGYIPVGTCEYGGIIYIVSYNPLEDKSQIGCFPSPERNISRDELGESEISIKKESFLNFVNAVPDGTIKNNTLCVLLKNDNLNPGDKFIICSDPELYGERISDLFVDKLDNEGFLPVPNPVIALNIVSIEESGKIVYLNSEVKKYTVPNSYTVLDDNGVSTTYNAEFKYHILGQMGKNAQTNKFDQSAINLNEYRNVLNSGYSVFKSKTSGKLAILAELIMIDSYSVTHSLLPITENSFNIIIHTEVEPAINDNNYYTVPKLRYYFLKNSLGYLQTKDGNLILYNKTSDGKVLLNDDFFVKLSDIYTPTSEINLQKDLEEKDFNFPKPETYHGKRVSYNGEINASVQNSILTKFTGENYHRIKKSLVLENYSYYVYTAEAEFYYFDDSEDCFEFNEETINNTYSYYIEEPKNVYYDALRDELHKGKQLYELKSIPQAAPDNVLKDIAIEKFLYLGVIIYKLATIEDVNSGKTLYIKTGDNEYTTLVGVPTLGTDYYIAIEERKLVSIGYDIKKEDYPGEIFYYPTTKDYAEASPEDIEAYFDFVTYPKTTEDPYGYTKNLYIKKIEKTYRPALKEEIENYKELNITLFYRTDYYPITSKDSFLSINESNYQLFIVFPTDIFISYSKFRPDAKYNLISGKEDLILKGPKEPETGYPKDDPISLYIISDFIPTNLEDDLDHLKYGDIKLASINIPEIVTENGLDLPFKYDYTIVPCMNYGKLEHLAVSNTVDFSKLHAFNQSDFTTWKYRIDGELLRLTFGTDIYDTYETEKVDGLILEFYDLWGFAGSIEITDKKSYSGKFTKVIPLNALGAISNRKIVNGDYNSDYTHNINIVYDPTKRILYNSKEVIHDNKLGWIYKDEDPIKVLENNDCGTLYSNLLYGVKTYLRRTKIDGSKEFIEKLQFFLYTLPILNDYYLTVNDFNTIHNPELELLLTYKIVDEGNKSAYNENGIVDGYNSVDKGNVDSYISGLYGDTLLEVTKYYKYLGVSKLYLEVGLKEEYSNLNIHYDPKINEHFSCTLQLISDDNSKNTFTVNSDSIELTTEEEILNYGDNIFNNSLYLPNNLTIENLSPYNFINTTDDTTTLNQPIEINYTFIVGYKALISDIRTTEIPATTVCALFHKQPDGSYNYEDFGIYLSDDLYLSEKMIYNSGNETQEIFGICRQIQTTGTMEEQCFSNGIEEVSDSLKITIPGRTNTGDSLKTIVHHLGKLQFCQPHVHGLYENTVTNIMKNLEDGNFYVNWITTGYENSLFKDPKYNLSVNTKNSINYNSEFISSIKGDCITLPVGDSQTYVATFSGLSGTLLEIFNKKLLETFKYVYAYNPDYDSLPVLIGNISLQKYNPYFTSNIISKNSNFAGNINDYFYLGTFKFSEYLKNINEYSGIVITEKDQNGDDIIKPLLLFIPNYMYCGTSELPYLISSLTYNTPVPKELELELEFNAKDTLVIKHFNGTNTLLSGKPNKKTLYGYDSEINKLVSLDVSNYTINEDGVLTIDNTIGYKENLFITFTNHTLLNNGYNFTSVFSGEDGVNSDISINLIISTGGANQKLLAIENDSLFIGVQRGISDGLTTEDGSNVIKGFNLNLSANVINNSSEYKYTISGVSVKAECEAKLLDPLLIKLESETINPLKSEEENFPETKGLVDCDYNILKALVNDTSSQIDLYEDGNLEDSNLYWIDSIAANHKINLNGSNIIETEIGLSSHSKFNIDLGEDAVGTELYQIKIKSIALEVAKISNLASLNNNVIDIDKTYNYYKIYLPTTLRLYTIRDQYKQTCLRGSTITLNDLIYEPNQEEHRLFIKNDLYKCKDKTQLQIYYRDIGSTNRDSINTLYLFTGPCFTEDNL